MFSYNIKADNLIFVYHTYIHLYLVSVYRLQDLNKVRNEVECFSKPTKLQCKANNCRTWYEYNNCEHLKNPKTKTTTSNLILYIQIDLNSYVVYVYTYNKVCDSLKLIN